MKRLLIALFMVGLLASTAAALPFGGPLYNSVENFDDYSTGTPDHANYQANWPGTRPEVGTVTDPDVPPFSAPNFAKIAPGAVFRASYDLAPDINAIDPTKHTVNGTDANPLVQSFNLDSNSGGLSDRKVCAFSIELSKGDVSAPLYPYNGPSLPVLAWGWYGGTHGLPAAANPFFFDGSHWTNIVVDQKNTLNDLTATIKTNTIEFNNSYDAEEYDDPDIKVRGYEGCFDTITMRSTGNAVVTRRVDDIAVSGGDLRVPEPASLSFLALGGLMLLRRRR